MVQEVRDFRHLTKRMARRIVDMDDQITAG
jgi:hypothetical protein